MAKKLPLIVCIFLLGVCMIGYSKAPGEQGLSDHIPNPISFFFGSFLCLDQTKGAIGNYSHTAWGPSGEQLITDYPIVVGINLPNPFLSCFKNVIIIEDHFAKAYIGGTTQVQDCQLDHRKPILNAKTTRSKQRQGHPVSSSDKFNVILSEPTNCTNGKDPLGICALHAQNFTGDGITIALLDYQYYADRLSERELPRKTIKIYNDTYNEDERHGIACAEIIGDVAPNATLYLVGIEKLSADGFKDAIEKMNHLNNKIDIVSCSLDFNSGRFDGQDDLCGPIRNLTRNGTLWINSAGDEAQCHWYGTWRDENGNGFNEFAPGLETLNLSAKRGMPLWARLSWNDSQTAASRDYDLYLLAPDGTSAVSDDPQKGYLGQKSEESIVMVAPVSGKYSIKIKRYDSSRDRTTFQLFTSQDLLEQNFENNSLGVLASCPEAISVGAINLSTLQLENYSSRGPAIDGRLKPELVAPDNITTESFMPDKFSGSSASAPYVAGAFALALEKGRKLGLTDADIKRLVLNSTLDLGPSGPDNGYGYGLINLDSLAKL
jgi:hypothetical protein